MTGAHGKPLVAARRGGALVTAAVLALVLLAGAWLRFNGGNWDEGRQLHPDERFLAGVTHDLRWPRSLEQYFDPQRSTLSPYTLPGMGLYVYGTLPVYVVKAAATLLDQHSREGIIRVGRAVSAGFDLAALGFVFLIGRRLYGRRAGLLAAGLQALSVLGIQLSHFYTVDTFATFFIIASFYFVLRAAGSGRWSDSALAGLLFGLGLASKLSSITLAAPVLAAAVAALAGRARSGDARPPAIRVLGRLLVLLAAAALTFRLVQPVAFSGPGFWDLAPNPRWLADLREQQQILSGQLDLPWTLQWANRPALYPLANLLLWGMGLPLGLAALAGLGLAAYQLLVERRLAHLLPLAFVAATWALHAGAYVRFMRYFYPIYPFLALLAAYFLIAGGQRSGRAWPELRSARSVLAVIVVLGTFGYALAFSSIYQRPNTRIAASRWMVAHIPTGSAIAYEHWDERLPLAGLDGKSPYGGAGLYKPVEMRNYDPDSPQKREQLLANLARADYLVLASSRLSGSITRLPWRYPITTRYYQLLLSGALGFEQVAAFTSYPTLLGLQIPDLAAEESFSVYDHPRVLVFKKTAAFDARALRAVLEDAWQPEVPAGQE